MKMLARTLLASAAVLLTHAVAKAETAPAPPLSGPVSPATAQRIAAGERVPVIVSLDLAGYGAPGALMSDSELARRTAALSETRDRVFAEVFGETFIREADGPSFAFEPVAEPPRVYREFSLFPGFAVEADAELLSRLRAHPLVTSIHEDAVARPLTDATPGIIGADAVWAAGFEGANGSVAVLDTGVELEHSATEDAIIASACFNTDIADRSSSLCPGGVEEVIDLTGGSAGDSCVEDDIDPVNGVDGCYHGTHVASTAAGRPVTLRSGTTVQGVARGADIVAVNVFSRFVEAECDEEDEPGPCVRSYSSDQLAALEWLFANREALNLRAVNMSLGGGEFTSPCLSNPLRSIVTALRGAGVATVISSGNDGFANAISGPACIPEAISVGATTDADAVASFSNSSPDLDLLAPGVRVLAAWQTETPPAGENCVINNAEPSGNGECNWFAESSGTSMAAPHVAGAFVLLRQAFPSTSVDDVLEALKFTGLQVLDVNGITRSRIRVDAAFDLLSRGGAFAGGVELTPLEAYRVSGEAGVPGSFASKTYTLQNTGFSTRTVTIIEAPAWVAPERSSFSITPMSTASLVLGVNIDSLPQSAAAGEVVIQIGTETISVPVSVQVSRTFSSAELGPFEWTGDRRSTTSSVFRIVGLDSGPPEAIDIALANAIAGDYSGNFSDCSLTIRPERFSNSEFVINSSDFEDCGDFNRADVTFRVTAALADIQNGLNARRFGVNNSGGLTDFGFDRDATVTPSAAVTRASASAGLATSLQRAADPGFTAPVRSVDAPAGAAPLQAGTAQAEYGPFEWTGDSQSFTGSVFRLTGLINAAPSGVEIAIDNATAPGYAGAFTDCALTIRSERYRNGEFVIFPSDLADCGPFIRGDLRFRVTADAGDIALLPQMRRFAITKAGGLTDFGFDLFPEPASALTPIAGTDEGFVEFGPFEWAGSPNAATTAIFRLVGIDATPVSIDVALDSALTPGYLGEFSDCSLIVTPARHSGREYLIFPDDLGVCGDFGRADVRFRVRARTADAPGGLTMRRFGIGSIGDITNLSFDHDPSPNSRVIATPAGAPPGTAAVEFGPFEWTGDRNSVTVHVFRITGLENAGPTSVEIAVDDAFNPAYAGDYSDCSLTIRPERYAADEFVIFPTDFADCGDFVRGDLRFRVLVDANDAADGLRMRRLAVLRAGGFTDFGFDQ